MLQPDPPPKKGRAANAAPPNRFGGIHAEPDFEHVADDAEWLEEQRTVATVFIPDSSRSIISENDSPDIPFNYSLNPYRGCEHGCAYCYARPTHEYLGFDAGLDFETKIIVKENAPALFRDWLARDAWTPEPIMFSGVTDCYQPAERRFQLTRGCLEVASEARQPVAIITKNALVSRDLDLLCEMSHHNAISVAISVTTLDEELARTMEPRTSTPAARLRTISELSAAGVRTHVMVAPVIPGLNDSEIPRILEAVRDAGADGASYILLRLPLTVEPVFVEWLRRIERNRAERVETRLRASRGGEMSDSRFGKRMRGEGEFAENIAKTFKVFARKYGLNARPAPLSTAAFRRPLPRSGQMRLF